MAGERTDAVDHGDDDGDHEGVKNRHDTHTASPHHTVKCPTPQFSAPPRPHTISLPPHQFHPIRSASGLCRFVCPSASRCDR
eukprot:2778309-Rhodomonas_salina.1